MKTFKKTFAMLLCLIMALGLLATTVSAAGAAAPEITRPEVYADTIDASAKGSLTVHMYESNTTGGNGNGTQDPTIPEGAVPLSDAVFHLVKVKTAEDLIAYYNGTSTLNLNIDDYLNDARDNVKPELNLDSSTTGTGPDGTATWNNLDVGLYVLVQFDAPDKVTKYVDPCFISVPMTDPTGDGWMYDVHVYPKNSTSVGNLVIKKVDRYNSPLGASFVVEKQDPATNEYGAISMPQSTDATGTITFSNLAHGNYRVCEINADTGYIVDARPIYFTVTQENKVVIGGASNFADRPNSLVTVAGSGTATMTLTVQNEKPAIKKNIRLPYNNVSAMPGSELEYCVTIDIPQNIEQLKTFTLTDHVSGTFVEGSICAEAAGGTGRPADINLADVARYTTTVGGAKGSKLTMTFDPEKLGSYKGQKIWVYYKVKLYDSTSFRTVTNTATLTYTNNFDSTGEQSTAAIADTVVAYNFGISIKKTSDTGALLNGVKFELYKAGSDTPIHFYQDGTASYFATTETEGTITELTTATNSENFNLYLRGLPAGTYHLKEISTLEGYNLLSEPFEIDLNFTVDDSTGTPVYKIGEETFEDGVRPVTVINKKGFTLPQTGGMGTLMFILIGGVLIAGGVFLMTRTGKKRAQ